MTINDMIDELEDFYESAGFADFYERILKNMSEEKIKESLISSYLSFSSLNLP